MAYRSTEKTEQKKDAKRMALIRAAVQIVSQKGYQSATVRDIVAEAGVSVGTFYVYFQDKETLFVHLYEETAVFLLQHIQQAIESRSSFPHKISAGLQSYVKIAIYQSPVVQLLFVGGGGVVPSLAQRQEEFRERLIRTWQRPLEENVQRGLMPPQNSRRMAEALVGAYDEVILNLLNYPDPDLEATAAIQDLIQFTLRATAYTGN